MKGRIAIRCMAGIVPWLLVTVTPCFGQGTASGRPTSQKPAVQVTRTDRANGTVLSEHRDDRTQVTVVVKGDTSFEQADAWLADAIRFAEPQVAALVASSHAQGLVAASFWHGDARVTVSWGPPPLEPGSGALVVSRFQDERTKVTILVRGDTSAETAKAWLAAAIATKGRDLGALVAAKQAEGLISTSKGSLTTWWEPRTR